MLRSSFPQVTAPNVKNPPPKCEAATALRKYLAPVFADRKSPSHAMGSSLPTIVLCLLAWFVWTCGVFGQEALTVPRHAECPSRPVPFRESIRPPDAWEMAWETTWPEASEALQAWRAGQFAELIAVWRGWAASSSDLTASAKERGLPVSAACLAWWSCCAGTSPSAHDASRMDAARLVLTSWSADMTPLVAMRQAHRASADPRDLDTWALSMRTGMRLMENLELPRIHVVQSGETVYSIARAFGIPPRCLAATNDVWDDLRPGMALIIPDLL